MKKTLLALSLLAIGGSSFAGMNADELALFDAMVEEDVTATLQGFGSAALRSAVGEAIETDIVTLQREFDRNELKANKSYKDKSVLVSGIVSEVKIGSFNTVMLHFAYNRFLTPTAMFEDQDKQTDYIAEFEPNQRIQLACKVDGMSLGAVRLDDCYTLPYVADMYKKKAGEVRKLFVKGKRPDDSDFLGVGRAVAAGVAVMTPEQRAQLSDKKKAIEIFQSVISMDLLEREDVKARLKELNLEQRK